MNNLYTLDQICKKITDGSHQSPKEDPTGYPMVSVKDMTEFGFDLSKAKHISKNDFEKLVKQGCKPEVDDILIAKDGSVMKHIFRVRNADNIVLLSSIAILRPNKEIVYPDFLVYSLKNNRVKEDILNNYVSGSGVPRIVLKDFKKVELDIPNLNLQINISKKLRSLDDKIQLNTQINQTLEQIAHALFKSWFVNFDPVRAKVQAISDGLSLEQAELAAMQAISGKTPEELTAFSQAQPERYAELAETAKAFPCEMVEVDGVEMPKGWELSTIGDCYDVVMGQSPKGETYNENKQGMLFYQGRAEFGWRFPTPRLFTTDPKRIAEQNSILMSVRAPVGDINIALEKCCIGRGLAALQHKSKSLSFGLYQIQSIKPELDLFNGEGTVFGSINQANLKNIQIINPDEKFIQLFEKYLSSCDSKIMNNEIENNALKEIRDLLLPRLLNGEI